jgi:hypothetical protein
VLPKPLEQYKEIEIRQIHSPARIEADDATERRRRALVLGDSTVGGLLLRKEMTLTKVISV